MIDYDLHIHTEYCGHAPGMTVEAICRRADELGLRMIAITDHIYGPHEKMSIDKIRRQVEKARPRCKVLVGAEIDVDANFTDGRLVVEDTSGLDYVLAGFHYVPTLGHYPRSPNERGMDELRFLEVWEKSLLGIVSNPKIDTLAHPGRLLASCVDLQVHFEYGLVVLERAAEISAQNSIAWELNELTGWRLPAAFQEQWVKIYEIALDAGVKLIYGSDAHHPDSIGMCIFTELILERLPAGCLSAPEDLLGAKR